MVNINNEAIDKKTGEVIIGKIEPVCNLREEIIDLFLMDKANDTTTLIEQIKSDLLVIIQKEINGVKDSTFDFLEFNETYIKEKFDTMKKLKVLQSIIEGNVLNLNLKDLYVGGIISFKDFRRYEGVYDYHSEILKHIV